MLVATTPQGVGGISVSDLLTVIQELVIHEEVTTFLSLTLLSVTEMCGKRCMSLDPGTL